MTMSSLPAGAPRVPPGRRRDIGLINTVICRLGMRAMKTGSLNLFTTMGRQRRMFKAWLLFGGTLMPGGRLPRRESELVILRVAARRKCAYELGHHERLASRAGLTSDEIERVQGDEIGPVWQMRDAALLQAADQLVSNKTIDDALWQLLTAHLTQAQLVELTMLVGHYDMLATFILTLGIEPDRLRR